MQKNYLLIKGVILLLFSGLASCTKIVEKAPDHPNIIVIMTDQQSASMMSCAGNTYIHTPVMDSIADNGIRFARAYAVNPVCSPSRFSLLTGWYPSKIGMYENEHVGLEKEKVIDLYANAMGNIFRRAGYQTYYGGKVHMPVTGPDVHVLGYELLTANERDSLATACADFLKNRKSTDKPFLLVASFINPHDICFDAIRSATPEDALARATPPELDEALKLPEGVSEAEFFLTYCPPLPDNFQPMIGEPGGIDYLLNIRKFRRIVRDEWTEKDWRMHRWAYLKLTERVDAQIGIVMEALRKSGLSDKTIIVFTSDHGDQDASHKLEHKTVFYEESAHIPFIVSYPWMKQKGVVDRDHLISNGLCLLPTLCDMAGIEPPDGLPGKSVVPLIDRQQGAVWPSVIFLENETGFMVHTGRYKFEMDEMGNNREMFVDLAKDPGEMTNLIHRPEYKPVIDSLRAGLIRHLTGAGIQFTQPAL
jgi:arylsulfatase A-like enzyme